MTEGNNNIRNRIEALLFVAGDPVSAVELSHALDVPVPEIREILRNMEEEYRTEERGIQLFLTEETAQLVSNRAYIDSIEAMLQPERQRNASQSILETLAVIAYRQPVTRADIEEVRGVRCDYAVNQLQNMGLIQMVGRKDTPGKPMQFGTTDAFLRKFGLHSLQELPEFSRFVKDTAERDGSLEFPVV